MIRTNYERGRAAEYYVKQLLERMGYRFIIRSAGSHTPIDLLASKGGDTPCKVIAIQVKGGLKSRMSRYEMKEFQDWAKAFNASPVLARKERGRWLLHTLEEIRYQSRP